VGFPLFFIAPIAQLNLTLFSSRLAESNSRKQGHGKFSVTQAVHVRLTVNIYSVYLYTVADMTTGPSSHDHLKTGQP
jgi:hypothetical protein